jgi:hypothetical protein
MRTPDPSPESKALAVLTGVATLTFVAAVYAADPRSRTIQEITDDESRRVADIIQPQALPQPQALGSASRKRHPNPAGAPVHPLELPEPGGTAGHAGESKAASAKKL